MTASDWIRQRLRSTPRPLLDTMLEATASYDDSHSPADGLAEAAITLYRRVVEGEGTRADALTLLAADALYTHAFQASAETNPGGITGFADRWSGRGRLGEILP